MASKRTKSAKTPLQCKLNKIEYIFKTRLSKTFHMWASDGLRYEIKEFVTAILSEEYYYSKLSIKKNVKMAEVQEGYLKGESLFKL